MQSDKALDLARPVLEQIASHPRAAPTAAQILWLATVAENRAAFVASTLEAIRESGSFDYVALAVASGGEWNIAAAAGSGSAPPLELLADVLDAEAIRSDGGWAAAPLGVRSGSSEVLVLHGEGGQQRAEQLSALDILAPVLRHALDAVERREQRRQHDERRIRQLDAILEIANQWNQNHEIEPLLVEIAEASTKVLEAERASIFLWDRTNHVLIGRPALGVDGGQLRVPDDQGIVGAVVQSGKSRRVDAGDNEGDINRQVDEQLGFRTETILCVPLRGGSGRLFGAFELINKNGGNFTSEDEEALTELAAHAAVALENTQEYQQLLSSRRQMADEAARGVELIGESAAIDALRSTAQRVANTDLAVLVLGENGTGKEVVAQLIHYLSDRRDEPIVAVTCAALTETLLESELFGHEKGAFTDAHEARAGKFEVASGGTLFLDEIGDLSIGGQAKLLRVLEEKIVVRVGGSVPISTDTRVIAATNQDLAEMVRERRFREDLFFRLNVVTLELPPLRGRGEDVILLADHFLRHFCTQARRKPPKLTAAAKKRLTGHTWPGNVRELRNLMERLAYLSQGEKIDAEDLAFISTGSANSSDLVPLDVSFAEATARFQVQLIERHIEAARGRMSDVAERLGMHRSNLYRKMRQLEMDAEK